MEKKFIIFANTIWFLEKFKFDLISSLSLENNIECLYLRTGPIIDESKINLLKKNNVKFIKVNIKLIFQILVKNITKKIKNKEENNLKNIIVFTIGPILLSSIMFYPFLNKTIIVIEGLGRVFSSRLVFYRLVKRIVQIFYKAIFPRCKYVLTLNYSDATYLAEMNIAPISKINTIPGTGIDTNALKKSEKNIIKSPKFIDFIARSLPEKGFYDFIYMREYLIRYNKNVADKYQFRIITPQSDIDLLFKKDNNFVRNSGILIKPYVSDPYIYYKDSKVIIIPTRYGEGLSRVVLEAIYLGIPLLVSRNQGTEEILPFNYKYFTISKNPSVLVSQLIELLKDSEYIKNTFLNQRLLIEEFYSTKKSIEVFSQFLN